MPRLAPKELKLEAKEREHLEKRNDSKGNGKMGIELR
jgi:hypothetical protein